ncbi:MAG: repressor LexA [Gammaproteobacteria bacterium RIFCSPHIGHO2_12_FULL_63_22]|jgi:repressor LexA|nr:MAG: repressor LexA [Gammaproteobacteria bacterium RIFCSPHIGHO2_12_FULL_63_22]
MQTLSETQQTILNLITDRVEFDGVPPSQAEIAKACGFSGVRAAQYHLDILEQAGFIKRIPGQARGIRLCRVDEDGESRNSSRADAAHRDDEVLRLPVLGRVAAGTPIGAGIASDETVLLDRSFFFPAPDYLLKVKGDSMRDDGILDGDLIGVHRTNVASSGQIVVARIDDEITVKLLKIGKDCIRLLPRNPDYQPIEVRPDQDFAIEGLYCGLVRPSR